MSAPFSNAVVQATLDFSRVERDFSSAVTEAARRAVSVMENNLEGIVDAAGDTADGVNREFENIVADIDTSGATEGLSRIESGARSVNQSLSRIDADAITRITRGAEGAEEALAELDRWQLNALIAEANRAGQNIGTEVAAGASQAERSIGQLDAAGLERLIGNAEEARRNIGQVGEEAEQVDSSAGGAGEKFGEWGGKIAGAAAGLAGVTAAMDTIMESIERDSLGNKLSAQLNLTAEDSAAAGQVAGNLYAQNYGESFEQVNEATGSVLSSLGNFSDDGAEQIESLTGKVLTLNSVFGIDTAEAAQAANNAIRNGLAKDAPEALDLIARTMQNVPESMREEVLPIMDEYAVNLNSLGFTGAEAFGLIANASQSGSIGMDKAGDAMKEFGIRATDIGDKGAQDALTALGFSGQDMANKLLAGGETARGAFDQIVGGLQGIEDPAEQAAAATALFGTPLEDLSKDQIPLFLAGMSNADSAIGESAGALDEMGATMSEGPGAALETFKRQVQDTLIDGLGSASSYLLDHKELMVGLGIAIGGLVAIYGALRVAAVVSAVAQGVMAAATGAGGVAAGSSAIATGAYAVAMGVMRAAALVGAAAQWALNAAMSANPIAIVVIAIAALVAGLVYFFTQTETGKAVITAVWEAIQSAISFAWNSVIKPVWDAMVAAFRFIGEVISTVWSTVISAVFDFFKAAVQIVGDVIMWLWQNVVVAAFNGIGTVISLWWAAVQAVFNFFKAALQVIGDAVLWFWQNVVVVAFDAIVAAINFWWSGVLVVFDLFKAGVGLLGDVVMWLWQTIIVPAFQAIGDTISVVWNSIIMPAVDGFKAGLQVLGDVASWLWNEAIKPAWQGIQDGLAALWGFVEPILGKIGDGFNALGDVASAVGSAIRGAFDGVVDVLLYPVHAIGKLLSSIPDSVLGIDIPGAGTLKNWGRTLQGLSGGGPVIGTEGTTTSDSILARLSRGEFVVNAAAYRANAPLVEAINSGANIAEMLPGFAGGGPVSADQLNRFPRENGLEGAVYDLGGVNWGDCSGAMSALANYATGREPFGSRFATGNQAEALAERGFLPGLGPAGSFNIGWYNGGPYGGHTAGTLPDGTNVEMGGSRGDGQVGGGALGADWSEFTDHAHLPPEFFIGGDDVSSATATPSGDVGAPGAGGGSGGGGGGGLGGGGGSGGSGGGAGGSGSGGTDGATRVFVTNWPGGMSLGSAAGTADAASAAGGSAPVAASGAAPAVEGGAGAESAPASGFDAANQWASEQDFRGQATDWAAGAAKEIGGEWLDPLGLGWVDKLVDGMKTAASAEPAPSGGDGKIADTVQFIGTDPQKMAEDLRRMLDERILALTGRFRNGG